MRCTLKFNDPNLTKEQREIRNQNINSRWSQLYSVSKESGDSAISYLFTTNAGGAVAVLAYLGSVSGKDGSFISAKLALISFFIGLLFVGFYKAYMVHDHENLFESYMKSVKDYYDCKICWSELTNSDIANTGNSKYPYIFGYLSFASLVFGCISGAYGLF